MLEPWVQFLINHNLKILVYIIGVIYAPFAILGYMAFVTLPELSKDIVRDFRSIRYAKKMRKK